MGLLPFSSPKLPHLLLGFLCLVVSPIATAAEPIYQTCPDSGANYTANGTFHSNLNRLLSSLAANGSATGFLNGTAGDFPERVYGLALCRGDVAAADCRRCLVTAEQEVLQLCPYKRSAVIWYDYCMLHYSNMQFFSEDDSFKVFSWDDRNLTEVAQFNRQLNTLMRRLARYAAYNGSARMFATGEADYVDAATPKIYGLVQCTRDLTEDVCSACLNGILDEIPSRFNRRSGARLLKVTLKDMGAVNVILGLKLTRSA